MNRGRDSNRSEGEYRVPTKFTCLDFPKFTQDDVTSWVSKCERFFSVGWHAGGK